MEILKWVQFVTGTGFLLLGLVFFALQVLGVFKFRYILNRMHSAAMGDTLGIGISLLGLMILSGLNFTTLKMAMVVVFLWCASPVSSHLIARLEAVTNPHLDKFCEVSDEILENLNREDKEIHSDHKTGSGGKEVS
ncbi:MAG: monovalent cation/H(+) antiporter subunit G [Blautia sp.]|nr:monovalent cation/H(+) antiporter subunit G [Blautia sp.]